jgi:nucleotide-binding universal stress UspA family protein
MREVHKQILSAIEKRRRSMVHQIQASRRTMRAQAGDLRLLRQRQRPLAAVVMLLVLPLVFAAGFVAEGWRRALKPRVPAGSPPTYLIRGTTWSVLLVREPK